MKAYKYFVMICILCQTDQNYRNGDILTVFFHFYFLNMDISLDIELSFLTLIENIHMQRTTSQISSLSPSFDVMTKNR